MRYHILGRTFERIAGTGFVIGEPDADVPTIHDIGAMSYAPAADLTDAQILALTIGAILKGLI